jgi:hypothetical protein
MSRCTGCESRNLALEDGVGEQAANTQMHAGEGNGLCPDINDTRARWMLRESLD